MTALKLTPSRLSLLRAIERGEVRWHRLLGYGVGAVVEWTRDGRTRKVTGRWRELLDAGLVELGPPPARAYAARATIVTIAGREVLAAHPEKESTDG